MYTCVYIYIYIYMQGVYFKVIEVESKEKMLKMMSNNHVCI